MPAPPKVPDALAQLALVPLRNAAVRESADGPDRMVLELAAIYPRWLGPLPGLIGARRDRRYILDGLALELWRCIDDRRNLGQLVDGLAASEQLAFNEARLLALHWLRNLSLKGLVFLGDR